MAARKKAPKKAGKKTSKKARRKPTKSTRSRATTLSWVRRPRRRTAWGKELQAKKRPVRRNADKILAERLVYVRQQQGLTQVIVAKETGIPYESLCGYERSESSAPFWRVSLLAIYYGVSLDYLAGGGTQRPKRKKSTGRRPRR